MTGKVWLIGAGPGDLELLTIKALKALQCCTVWLVDDLVNPNIVELATSQTKIIKVGKRGGCRSTPQDFINRIMRRYAKQGYQVARLKGGDPFIFGRGIEEWEWLLRHQIDVECISGISAGIAVAAKSGIPLTHRGTSRGVAFITGHTIDGQAVDWNALRQSGLTIVCYMGITQHHHIQMQMLSAAFPSNFPIAIIQNVSLPNEKTIITQLAQLSNTIHQHRIQSPAVMVMGQAILETNVHLQLAYKVA